MQHKLPLNPECSRVKQKLRRMKPEMSLKIMEEVKKQFDASFLVVARYPEWVANIMTVPKKDGKVRMCVDYRDLNQASPKDNFPLLHIDVLIDNTAYVDAPPVQPRLSSASLMVARVMLRDVYEPEIGLGRNGNGTTSLVRFVENHGRYGLGYEPTHADKRKVALERKERSLAYLQGRGPQIERVPICHISKSFVSVGWMHQNQVVVLDEETNQKQPSWVQSCSRVSN